MKTDKKIEYGEWEHGFSKLIEECSDGYVFDHDVWRDELYAYIHNNYTPNTEVQKAVEEAVRGFVDTIEWEKIDGVDDDDTIRGRNLVEQMETYLQSLDKGDTDK